MAAIKGWHTKQLDYVLAFPQADVERDNLYMRLPHGFTGPDGTKDYALKIHKNIYGQRQAGRVWFQHLVLRLKKIGFKQSRVDECLLTKGNVLYVLYTDDSLLAGPDENPTLSSK
jgi:hypothetical protein